MNDDFLRNKIKESAENIEIPDSLKPDAVQKILERSSRRVRRFPSRLLASAAAAILVLSIGVFGINRFTQNSIMDGDGMERSEEVLEEAYTESSSSLHSISDYSELYQALRTYEDEHYTIYDMEISEESVAESADITVTHN